MGWGVSAMKELFNLAGKRAVVTGSSQGIGRAIALALAECGADVLVHCAGSLDQAAVVRDEIASFGVRSAFVAAPLEGSSAAQAIQAAAGEWFGGVDILILNASVQIRKEWREIAQEEYRRQIDVNFGASLWLAQAFAPEMCERRWGRILAIGSVQQVRPHPAMLVYAASKCAQGSMVRSLAPHLAPYGVTINNLAPGAIATGRNEQVLADETYRRAVCGKIPLGYVGEPRDCAAMAALLCSEAGRYVTGQDIYVDGGMGLP